MAKNSKDLVPIEVIERRVFLARGRKVMLSIHLADLYEVEPKILVQAVKRNIERFPSDFMFQLNAREFRSLRSQFVTLEKGRGRYPKYRPYAFTEQGVAMLSSVLKSKRAVQVNIAIMRTFVRLREILATHKDLAEKLEAIERKCDRQFKVVFEILKQLTEPSPGSRKCPIGFISDGGKK
jgi:phage regulator Rha-like protein